MKKNFLIPICIILISCLSEPKKENTDSQIFKNELEKSDINNDSQTTDESKTYSDFNEPLISKEEQDPIDKGYLTSNSPIYVRYERLLKFMHKRRDYFKEIIPDVENLINYRKLSLNNNLIPLLDIKMEYMSGNELKNVSKNLTDGNFVLFGCLNKEDCIYNTINQENSIALIQPLETKEDCFELINLIDEIKREVVKY